VNEVISSAANPLVKRVRQLAADRRTRRREGAFVVEGIQPVWMAIEAGWTVETLVVADEGSGPPGGGLPERVVALVAEQEAAGVRVARLTPELFGRVSERDAGVGLLAVVASRPALSLDEVRPGPEELFVVLDRIANPGNLGTILRTADAAGVAGLVLLGDATDPYAPGVIRASMGSIFGQRLIAVRNATDLVDWARDQEVQLVAASGGAAEPHWRTEFRRPAALLLGSEREGLPPDLLAQADARVRIPMTGTAESLNLAVAAGIMMYELQRHRLA